MTKEIKEILEDFKKFANEGGEHNLMEYEIKHIQCYITNLQQLYENALKVNQNENKYRTELEDKYVVLQQENEMLKEYIKMYKCDYSPLYKELKENDEK